MVFARDIVDLIYNERYANAARILMIVAPFIAATLINTFLAYGLIAIGEERLYLSAAVRSGMLFTIVLIASAIGFGLDGIAVAMVLGEIAMCVWLYGYFRRHAQVHPTRPLMVCTAIALALASFAAVVDSTSLWQMPLYAAAYAGGVYVLGGATLDDIRARA